jgi:non-ribosomal peptide synthetase component E (peptide arylation enzyme)
MAEATIRKKKELQEFIDKGLWEDLTWSELWDRNARDYPDREAIVDVKTRLTWGQAKQAIDRLALGFMELGYKKDDAIVVELPGWVECMLIRIACEKAGLLVAPVLRSFRELEMKHTLALLQAKGVVIPYKFRDFDYYNMIQSLRPELPKLEHIFIVGYEVPEGCISLNKMMQEPLEQKYSPEQLEKLFAEKRMPSTEVSELSHTTGSTGVPKLAEWPSVLGITRSKNTNMKLGITSADNVGALAPGWGGMNNPVYHGGPLAGAKMVMLDHWDIAEAMKLIEKERITYFAITPTMMRQMLDHPDFGKYDLSSVRAIMVSGAPCPPGWPREAEEKIGAKIINTYGSRDLGSTASPTVDDPPEIRWATAGKSNTWDEIMLFDSSGKEVSKGEVGEVVVKAVTGSAGYFKNPEATKEAIGADGLFHIGDLAKLDDNGNLVIVGRAKNIIIRGGENIYPNEIENLLGTHPKVTQAAVVKMPDPLFGERACAYVSIKPGEEFTFDEMVSYLKEKKIAAFKLPERLEIVDKIPMVGDGIKVDLKGLEKDIADKLKAEGKI